MALQGMTLDTTTGDSINQYKTINAVKHMLITNNFHIERANSNWSYTTITAGSFQYHEIIEFYK